MSADPTADPTAGTPGRIPAARDRDRGAVFVEFAGLFPLILFMVVAVWQCVLIGYAFSLAGNAADEAARAAAAADGDAASACATAAREHLPDSWDAAVSCPLEGNVRTAHVDLTVPAIFPGALNLPLTISATSAAAEEG